MSFNSLHYLVFFCLVLIGFFLLKPKNRWILLLPFSLLFYASWHKFYLVLIIFSTISSYVVALLLSYSVNNKLRRIILFTGIGANLFILFIYKYFNFFNDNIAEIVSIFGFSNPLPTLNLILPVGISFYTFQVISYILDVYRKDIEPERNIFLYTLYVSFFPQLVAGPIERSTNFLPQLRAPIHSSYLRFCSGFRLILWGLFKKAVIADNLAEFVNFVYSSPGNVSHLLLMLATFMFGFQLYCDFSGYADIAIGSARMLGIDLMINFRRPYFSKSISEMWRRWHISLSNWVHDYIYNPLVIKWRFFGKKGIVSALFISFVLVGLWHGPKWTFILFGVLHGFFLSLELSYKTSFRKSFSFLPTYLQNFLARFYTLAVWFYSLVLFRANSVSDFIKLIFGASATSSESILYECSIASIVLGGLGILALLIYESVEEWAPQLLSKFEEGNVLLRQMPFAIMLFLIVFFGKFGEEQFIYFQF